MLQQNEKTRKFHTEIFKEALKVNEEMNTLGHVKKEDPLKDGSFHTDAFAEALRINEEMNRRWAKKKAGESNKASATETGKESSPD